METVPSWDDVLERLRAVIGHASPEAAPLSSLVPSQRLSALRRLLDARLRADGTELGDMRRAQAHQAVGQTAAALAAADLASLLPVLARSETVLTRLLAEGPALWVYEWLAERNPGPDLAAVMVVHLSARPGAETLAAKLEPRLQALANAFTEGDELSQREACLAFLPRIRGDEANSEMLHAVLEGFAGRLEPASVAVEEVWLAGLLAELETIDPDEAGAHRVTGLILRLALTSPVFSPELFERFLRTPACHDRAIWRQVAAATEPMAPAMRQWFLETETSNRELAILLCNSSLRDSDALWRRALDPSRIEQFTSLLTRDAVPAPRRAVLLDHLIAKAESALPSHLILAIIRHAPDTLDSISRPTVLWLLRHPHSEIRSAVVRLIDRLEPSGRPCMRPGRETVAPRRGE